MTRITSSRSLRAILPAALLFASLSAGAARAAEADLDAHSVAVSLSGLDMSSSAGQASAHRRIATAAARACDQPDIRDLAARDRFDACRDQAAALAVVALDQRIAAAQPARAVSHFADAAR